MNVLRLEDIKKEQKLDREILRRWRKEDESDARFYFWLLAGFIAVALAGFLVGVFYVT